MYSSSEVRDLVKTDYSMMAKIELEMAAKELNEKPSFTHMKVLCPGFSPPPFVDPPEFDLTPYIFALQQEHTPKVKFKLNIN
jgi:hypothetical protein